MKKFKRAYIEITNICNLSCKFCPKTKRKYDTLTEDKFIYLINEIKEYTDCIYFHLMGEPMVNPHFVKFLEIAYDNNITVNITTNGTLLNKYKKELIMSKAIRQINVSLHSFEANDSNVTFEKYFDDVLEFANEFNMESKGYISLRLWNLDSYRVKGDNDLNKLIIEKIKSKFKFEEEILDLLKLKSSLKVRDRLFINSAEKFQWPSMDADYIGEDGFCQGLRSHFGVLVDGTVVPCCLDSEGIINLGNIYKDGLKNVLEGQRAKAIYNGFCSRKRVEELCKRCGYSQVFSKK